MPVLPARRDIRMTSAGYLNMARALASPEFQAGVPIAEDTAASIRAIGDAILGFQPRLNEFIDVVNRIALIEFASKTWEFPWAFAQRGQLTYGETIEELYVHMAEPYIYHIKQDGQSMDEFIKFYKPKVNAAFHTLNSQIYYPISVTESMLQRAFLSADGISRMVSQLVDALYRGAYQDMYLMIRYMLCRLALNGKIAVNTVTEGQTADESAKNLRKAIIATSDDFTINSPDYTMAGVPNFSAKEDQFLFVTPSVNADQMVEVLAAAFNMNQVQFSGHQVLIKNWTFNDWEYERLDKLMADSSEYAHFTEDEEEALDALEGFLCDRNWFMIYNQKRELTSDKIGMSLMNQYALHEWNLYSASPFQNAVLFSTSDNVVTGITYSPLSVNVATGGQAIIHVQELATTGLPKLTGSWYQSAASAFTSPQKIDADSFTTVLATDTDLTFTAPNSAQTIYIAFVPDAIQGGATTDSAVTAWGSAHNVAVTVVANA